MTQPTFELLFLNMHLYVADAYTYRYSRKFVFFRNLVKKKKKKTEIVIFAPRHFSIFKRGHLFFYQKTGACPFAPLVPYPFLSPRDSPLLRGKAEVRGINIDPAISIKKIYATVPILQITNYKHIHTLKH